MTKAKLENSKKLQKKVEAYADDMEALTDQELQAKTPEFKKTLSSRRNTRRLATRSIRGST